MPQRFFTALLLLLSVGILCWCAPISAHDAFYPHHREDFENITRRRELRTTVLLSTAVFLCVLGAVIYVAMRKSGEETDVNEREAKTVEERLRHAVHNAGTAARQVLDATGNIAEATTACFSTYAEASGVAWQSRSDIQNRPESLPYQIRCKIGSDIVTLSINTEIVQLKAEHSASKTCFGSPIARATVVLERLGTEKV